VSPARARTSSAEIVAAGRELLEAGGLDAVTMQAVAHRVGVRAPSLYKRFPSRGALIAAIATTALNDLRDLLAPLAVNADARDGARRIATAFRRFAHQNPRAYEVLFMNLPADHRPQPELFAEAAAPLIQVVERLVGSERALDAARLVTAYAHGFVSMELTGAFRLGGDVNAAFGYGLDALVDSLRDPRAGAKARTPVSRRTRRSKSH
jgi:AcrR family transcriptional regulator